MDPAGQEEYFHSNDLFAVADTRMVSKQREGKFWVAFYMQGSPLSPLLSNIVLDELDQELSRRGLSFVRYADDVQILVSSQKSEKGTGKRHIFHRKQDVVSRGWMQYFRLAQMKSKLMVIEGWLRRRLKML